MSTGTIRVGIELDGTRATVVTVQDSTATDVETFTSATGESALASALASVRRTDPVRATLLTPGVLTARADLTAKHLSRGPLTELAYRVTGAPRHGTAVAALIADDSALRSALVSAGLLATAPAQPMESLYRAMAGRSSEVVPAPFTAAELEGLSLAIRYSGSELTLVVDGIVTASRQLPAGGMAAVESALGAEDGIGAARVEQALNGTAATDLIASRELERYLRAVLTDTRDTVEAWARQGLRVSDDLIIHGAGARARALDVLLGDLSLTRAARPAVLDGLLRVPAEQRPGALGAYLAALTYGQDLPYALFLDPERVAASERAETRRRRTRRIRILAGAAALFAVIGAGPAAWGAVGRYDAASALSSARSSAGAGTGAAQQLQLRRAALAQLAVTDENPATLGNIAAAAPTGLTLTALALTGRGGVTVTGTGTSATVKAYLSALTTLPGVSGLTPTSENDALSGAVTFTITLTLGGAHR